jgi:hypothetical protein
MNKLQNILLTIVTENQSYIENAEQFAESLQNELGEDWVILAIDKYYKFENSFIIELKGTYSKKQLGELNLLGISLADKLVSPWLVYYDEDENTIELIYNKDENTQKRRVEFNAIKWSHLQITK